MAFAELRADEYAALLARALGLAPDGMTVAVQIVGPFGSDALVLAFAREVESALAFREHHPLRLTAS
jgi:Asp-tRNA(Asn)/Glu-tRNA(Gln) amidotransferase A subunit family amidase